MASIDMETSAQEMAMHIALCVCAEYIQSWGLAEFLTKLEHYSAEETLEAVRLYAQKMEEET